MSERAGPLEQLISDWWATVVQKSKDGRSVIGDIALIDAALRTTEQRVMAGELTAAETKDFRRAQALHALRKAAMDDNTLSLDRWHDYWRERAISTERFATQLTHEGMKYTLAIHGAAAITCINGIISKSTNSFSGALIFGALAATLGILMLGLGQFILVEILGKHSNRISSSIRNPRGWRQLEAIARWVDTSIDRPLKLAERLILASMLWFPIYMFVCLILIAS